MLATAVAAPARGQRAGAGRLELAGRVVLVRGGDTTALVGQRVVAHRVGTVVQGPVDSLRSGARGRFRFRITRPDTAAMYLVSTLYKGIGYFSAPFSTAEPAGADSIVLAVFDTSSTGTPLVVMMRHVVVARANSDGSRDVLDIVQVGNGGATTRVPRTPTTPTWWMRLPAGVTGFEVGQGDVPSSAIRRSGDSVLVTAPFPPGSKQVVLTYVAPRGLKVLRVPVDQPTEQLELLLEDSLATATGPGVAAADPLQIQDRTFRRFSGQHLGAGDVETITFRATGGARHLEWLAIVLSAGLLGLGAYAAARRRGPVLTRETTGGGAAAPSGAPPAAADRDTLVRQIVALDERYASRQAETPPEEWASYQAKRAALKAELAERLARR